MGIEPPLTSRRIRRWRGPPRPATCLPELAQTSAHLRLPALTDRVVELSGYSPVIFVLAAFVVGGAAVSE